MRSRVAGTALPKTHGRQPLTSGATAAGTASPGLNRRGQEPGPAGLGERRYLLQRQGRGRQAGSRHVAYGSRRGTRGEVNLQHLDTEAEVGGGRTWFLRDGPRLGFPPLPVVFHLERYKELVTQEF